MRNLSEVQLSQGHPWIFLDLCSAIPSLTKNRDNRKKLTKSSYFIYQEPLFSRTLLPIYPKTRIPSRTSSRCHKSETQRKQKMNQLWAFQSQSSAKRQKNPSKLSLDKSKGHSLDLDLPYRPYLEMVDPNLLLWEQCPICSRIAICQKI